MFVAHAHSHASQETGFANVREYEEKRLKVCSALSSLARDLTETKVMKSRAERVLELNTLHSKLINQCVLQLAEAERHVVHNV